MNEVSPYIYPGLEWEIPNMKLTEEALPIIIKVVENVTGVPVFKIKSKDRFDDIIFARHLFVGTAMTNTNCSSRVISKFINRERSTLSNSKAELKSLLETNSKMADQFNKIKEQLFKLYNQ